MSARKDNYYVVASTGYETPCWVWTGANAGSGYGQDFYKGKKWRAHRSMYDRLVGPIPLGMDLDHLCRNRRCVNPEHLEPVTRRENLLRGQTRTARNAGVTHCPQGHPYDEANTHITVRGGRVCRACSRERNNKRYHKQTGIVHAQWDGWVATAACGFDVISSPSMIVVDLETWNGLPESRRCKRCIKSVVAREGIVS